jgi:hypothetical protein
LHGELLIGTVFAPSGARTVKLVANECTDFVDVKASGFKAFQQGMVVTPQTVQSKASKIQAFSTRFNNL